MAGEWIAIDIGLPDKPEVQELIDLTGEPVEVVVFRLFRLWGWASMHCADGMARMTLARLVRTCGADEGFWRAVASVGWLEIDETVATVAVPGWDRRFSQAAKSRIQHRDRAAGQNDRQPDRRRRAGVACADAQALPAPTRSRGEEIREESLLLPREAWEKFREAWNAGKGRPWMPHDPPQGWNDRLSESGWLEAATQAIGRLAACRYFKTPVTLIQFVKPGWVDNLLGGAFDTPRGEARPGEDKPPPKSWKGEYRQAPYRTPKEVAALATSIQLPKEDT
jgi:hypothetical protein